MIKVQALEFKFTERFNSVSDYISDLERDKSLQTEVNLDNAFHSLTCIKQTLLEQFKQETGVDWLDVCRHLTTSGIRKQDILDKCDILFAQLIDINDLQNRLDKLVFSKWNRG